MRKVKPVAAVLALSFLLTGCGLFTVKMTPSERPGEALNSVQDGECEETPGGAAAIDSAAQESVMHDAGSVTESGRGMTIADGGNGQGAESAQASESSDVESAASVAEPAEEDPEITLVMVGDILLHTPLAESGKKEEGGYDFSAVFSHMKEDIEEADLALVNQEVIIGGEELGVSGYPAFNAPYELGDALVDAGFDVALHATNHALDKGKRGLLNCLSFWEENYPDMEVLGIHDSAEDQAEIYVYEEDGISVAILNYSYGTNGIPLPSGMSYAVDMLEKERVVSDLQRANELADFVIVCPHWGTEYVLSETAEQEKWAKLFAENGADLVLGTHPHVIEPIKWVDDTLIFYSLGNFVNWTSGTGVGVANRMVGGMAEVTIGRDENGEVVIKESGVKPVVCHLEQGFGGVTVYPLEDYTKELAARNEIIKQDNSFSLEYCQQLVQDVFGEWADADLEAKQLRVGRRESVRMSHGGKYE